MIPVFEKIEIIKEKLILLLRENEGLYKENVILQNEVYVLNNELQKQQILIEENQQLRLDLLTKKEKEQELAKTVSEMEQQLKEMKKSSYEKDENAVKNIEKQVNHYIREIDRCISLLSQ
jgi:septum formation inhibitor MinC